MNGWRLYVLGAVAAVAVVALVALGGDTVVPTPPPRRAAQPRLAWPVASRGVSSPFGVRRDPITGASGAFHNGVDIPTPVGSPVYAPCDGTVRSRWLDSVHGGGNSLILDHADHVATGYAHLSMFSVEAGDKVFAGQLIAFSGGEKGAPGAGASTGPHLHWTVMRDGVAVDPLGELLAGMGVA